MSSKVAYGLSYWCVSSPLSTLTDSGHMYLLWVYCCMRFKYNSWGGIQSVFSYKFWCIHSLLFRLCYDSSELDSLDLVHRPKLTMKTVNEKRKTYSMIDQNYCISTESNTCILKLWSRIKNLCMLEFKLCQLKKFTNDWFNLRYNQIWNCPKSFRY